MAEESELQFPKVAPQPKTYLSKDLVSTENPYLGTEFNGVDGLIQPMPHRPTARERLAMIYAIEPTDPGTEPTSVLAPELEGEF